MAENSSSSDELSNVKSSFNVPSVNLAHLRKKDGKKINPKTNLVKARNKLTPGKTVRFPDSHNYRNLILSNSSTTNVSDDSDLDCSTEIPGREGPLKLLPNFLFNVPHNQDSSDSDASGSPSADYNPVHTYHYDSSDDDFEGRPPSRGRSMHSVGSGSLSSDKPRKETDITEIHKPQSAHSDGLGDIFRQVSLQEQAQGESAPSRSDTFLGKVLNFAGASSTLNGGGLAPGASSHSEEAMDEEKTVGGATEQPIEMRNLNFDQLNEEAKNLIFAHAPDVQDQAKIQLYENSDVDTQADSTAFLLDNEKPVGQSLPDKDADVFYQPNPDLLKEDLDDDIRDDEFFEGGEYIAPPKQVHAGVLSSLLKLYQNPGDNKSQATLPSMGGHLADEQFEEFGEKLHRDFKKYGRKIKSGPKRLAGRIYSGKQASTPTEYNSPSDGEDEKLEGDAAKLPSFQNARPKAPKGDPKKLGKKFKKNNQKLRITVHIADILQRQRFIIRMCRALMMYGAPTHRLEEYMVMTSRVLEIDGQFVYFPGTMIIAFGDAATRTSEVHLVRCAQGVNLSKLADTHKIYKDVIHDITGVEEAGLKLEELLKSKNQYLALLCVLLFGFGSASVCTFGFGGGWYDIPIAFSLGLIIGYLQFFMSSKSHLYSSVFEVTASIVVSFVARGIGSIRGNYFCFGAITQGSLALILPGYIILCGSLELQSKNLVAGSVRMFYAIIYSLFLGFGITLGAALYGWVDKGATDEATCSTQHGVDDKWRILFVPLFSCCLGLLNQARFSQLPVMTFITAVSYVGTYFAGKHFSNVTEFTAAIGAFIIGILGNMYSRIGKGMAVSAMLPAIFVQVPSGIASKSTLLAGVSTANKITNSSSSTSTSTDLSSLSFGATMVEVSIGISVGLFAAALIVYPFGKRRSGLFTL